MNSLEKELSHRVRKLLSFAKPDKSEAREFHHGPLRACLTYSKDGDDEFLNVSLHGRVIYEEHDGESVRVGVHFIDRIHAAVLELRKRMLLDDLADGVEAPMDSILERDDE